MPRRKNRSLLAYILRAIVKTGWYWITVPIPVALQYATSLGWDKGVIGHIPSWLWWVASLILLGVALAQGVRKHKEELDTEAEQPIRNSEANAEYQGQAITIGGNVSHSTIVQAGTARESSQPRNISADVIPRAKDGYISAVVHNNENRTIECYCTFESFELDGEIDQGFKSRITEHTSRVSWSGGSDKEVGIKQIDAHQDGTLNIAEVEKLTLRFWTAKGQRETDNGYG